jgi:hypothetical protein
MHELATCDFYLRIWVFKGSSGDGGLFLQHIGDTDANFGSAHPQGEGLLFLTLYWGIIRCQHIYTPGWKSRFFHTVLDIMGVDFRILYPRVQGILCIPNREFPFGLGNIQVCTQQCSTRSLHHIPAFTLAIYCSLLFACRRVSNSLMFTDAGDA